MRKSPLGFVKWFAGGMRDALRHPQTDRMAKAQLLVWSLLLVVVVTNLGMMALLGNVSAFTIGFTVFGLCIYAVCLKQAFEGWKYRMKIHAARQDREAFDKIVNGL